jgi:UDP-N-acetyl-D-mannosaminuronate dehydrogenase
LQEASAEVKAFDPYANHSHLPELTLVDDLESEIPTTDIMIALVAHQQFKQIDPVLLARFNPSLTCFDTVNIWRSPVWAASGMHVFHLGNGKESNFS